MKYLFIIKKKINLVIFILNLFILSFLYANSSNWFIKAGNYEITIDEFKKDFLSYLKFEFFTNSQLEDNTKSLEVDEKIQAMFLQNYINDLLILEEAKEKNLFNPEELDKQLESFSKILKKVIIKKLFLLKEIRPSIKNLDPHIVEETFNNITNNPNSKNLSLKEKKQLAEDKVLIKELENKFLEKINELRGKKIIKINDDFF